MGMKNPVHPGALIRGDCLTPLGLSVAEGARRLGVGRQTLSRLVNEKASVSLAMAYRLGGRIELGAWIDLSVEGARSTQGGGAAPQGALDDNLGWQAPPLSPALLRRGEKSFALPPRRVDRPERGGRTHHAGRRRRTPSYL